MSNESNNPDKKDSNGEEIYEKIKSLSVGEDIKEKLIALQKLKDEVSIVEDTSMEKELLELTSVYNAQFKAIEAEMSKVIQGDNNFTLPPQILAKYKLPTMSKDKIKEIPSYWMIVIKNSGFFKLSKHDEDVLKKLKDIGIEMHEDNLSYTLRYHFDKNNAFNNNILEKTYYLDKKSKDCFETKASEIKWKNKDIKKIFSNSQFFAMFTSHSSNDPLIDDENTEGDQLKNDLIPFSLEFYLNLMTIDN